MWKAARGTGLTKAAHYTEARSSTLESGFDTLAISNTSFLAATLDQLLART